MTVLSYLLPVLITGGLTLAALFFSALLMRRSGMLPAQQRLDEVLKETVSALENRVKVLEDQLHASRQQIDQAASRIADLEGQHIKELSERDATVASLQAALMREYQSSDEMRAKMADAEQKIIALIAYQNKDSAPRG